MWVEKRVRNEIIGVYQVHSEGLLPDEHPVVILSRTDWQRLVRLVTLGDYVIDSEELDETLAIIQRTEKNNE